MTKTTVLAASVVWGLFFVGNERVNAQPLIPVYPLSSSMESYIDQNGAVKIPISLGEIDFGKGLKIPLTLNYASRKRAASPEFGEGWSCPVFDSLMVNEKENLKSMMTLGGKVLYFVPVPREGNSKWKHYYTDHWFGEEKGNGGFEVNFYNGCKLIYVKGLISEVITPDGRSILWSRNGTKVTQIAERGKDPALKVNYDEQGFAKELVMQPGGMAELASVYELTPDLVYAGIKRIKTPQGGALDFSRSKDDALNPVFKILRGGDEALTVTWDGKTGKILSDGAWDYKIVDKNKDKIYAEMNRTHKKNGKKESYYYNPETGITVQQFASGVRRTTYQIVAPGPLYKETRLIEEFEKGKTRVIQRKSFDHQGRLIGEIIGLANGKESNRQYVYDEQGRMISYIFNGQAVWKDVYAANGQLKERELPQQGVKAVFDYGINGEVTQTVVKNKEELSQVKYNAEEWKQAASAMRNLMR